MGLPAKWITRPSLVTERITSATFLKCADLQYEFCNNERHGPVHPRTQIPKRLYTDDRFEKVQVRYDASGHKASARENVRPNHPLFVDADVTQADSVISHRGRCQPKEAIQEQTKSVNHTAKPRMQTHI